MRPVRFVDHVVESVRTDPQPTGAWTFAQCRYDRTPYGVVLGLPTRALVYWQVVTRPWAGDNYAAPEQPAYGEPAAAVAAPVLPTDGLAVIGDVERYMAALLTGTCKEVKAVAAFADRPEDGAIPYGVAVEFHNGAAAYLYARHCLPPGRELAGHDPAFRRRDAI